MAPQKENPGKRANAAGVEIAVSPMKGTYQMNHTTDPKAPDADFQAGQAAALTWFNQAMQTMADYRDAARCALVRGIEDEAEAAAASYLFDEGFSHGIAQALAGVRHG